ncbi:MAG: hypothetical protein WCK01_03195 [Candidatus Uhrbacteria bacterium]
MSIIVAKALVGNYWRFGTKDSRFEAALAVLGLTVAELEHCSSEARKVERGIGPLILTPAGCGRNR